MNSKRPVSLLIAIILILVYIFAPKELIDCDDKSAKQHIINSFFHAGLFHLLSNLFTLYQVSKLEEIYGSIPFLILVLAILLLSNFIHSLIPDAKCTIGFSGVLIGLIIFDRLLNNNWLIDLDLIQYILITVVVPYFRSPNLSILGHLSGALAAIIIAMGINFLFKK